MGREETGAEERAAPVKEGWKEDVKELTKAVMLLGYLDDWRVRKLVLGEVRQAAG